MSGRLGRMTIICETEPDKCELCGELKELRPYGPNGENVCFKCAIKDLANMDKRSDMFLFGQIKEILK